MSRYVLLHLVAKRLTAISSVSAVAREEF